MSVSTSNERLSQIPSRWVITSGGQDVLDGPSGENSPFAQVLIEILEKNEGDLNITKLGDSLLSKISFHSRQLPNVAPLMNVGHQGGQFIFRAKKKLDDTGKQDIAPKETLKESSLSQKEEKEAWKNALKRNTIERYQSYLSKYPKGEYIQEAEIIIELLEREKSRNDDNLKKEAVERLIIDLCKKQNDFNEYLKLFPNAIYRNEALKELAKLSDNINKNTIQECRWIFSQGQTEEAIKILLKKNFESYDDAVLISNRLLTLLNKESKGVLSKENFDLEFNRISLGFLGLLKDLENSLDE